MTTDAEEILTPGMIRAARGLLGFDQAKVAALADLKQRTISKLEGENELFSKDKRRRAALAAIRKAFESEGIEFIFPSEKAGQGVRMKSNP